VFIFVVGAILLTLNLATMDMALSARGVALGSLANSLNMLSAAFVWAIICKKSCVPSTTLAILTLFLAISVSLWTLVESASSVHQCYSKPLELKGNPTEAQMASTAKMAAKFSECTEECMMSQLTLGVHDSESTGLVEKIGLAPELYDAIQTCESSFIANGMEIPKEETNSFFQLFTAASAGTSLRELGTACGEAARANGCKLDAVVTSIVGIISMLAVCAQARLISVLRQWSSAVDLVASDAGNMI
jgi:hypothetical protein